MLESGGLDTDCDCTGVETCSVVPNLCRKLLKLVEDREVGGPGTTRRACRISRGVLETSGIIKSREAREALKRATVLRDIGKICIEESILNSPDSFEPTDPRRQEIMRHAEAGASLLGDVLGIGPEVINLIRNHHPWYRDEADGYAETAAYDEYSVCCTILSMTDAYVGLRSRRARRDTPLGHVETRKIMMEDLKDRKYPASMLLFLSSKFEKLYDGQRPV